MTTLKPPAMRVVPWTSVSRRGPREDRTLAEVRVSVAPTIATLTPPDAPSRDLERVAGSRLTPLAGFLIRMESVASSCIEHVEATPVAFARAIARLTEQSSAMSMVAAGAAITRLISVEAMAPREARGTAGSFAAFEDTWRDQVKPRAGDRILTALLGLPVFTIEQLARATGIAERSVYRGIETLEKHHIVEAVTERVRDRTYAAMDVLDEFEDLDNRIRERITRLREA